MSDFGDFGVIFISSASACNMSMSQDPFILSYCKLSEEQFTTRIPSPSQTVLELVQPEGYQIIPSLGGDILAPGQDIYIMTL